MFQRNFLQGSWSSWSFQTKNWILILILMINLCGQCCNIFSHGYVLTRPTNNLEDAEFYSSQPGAEIAHISFITELRHKRDLSRNEYHIIKLTSQNTVNTKTQSMEIHLHKREAITSTDFQIVIKNGDQIEEEEEEEEIDYSINDNNNNGTEDCLYDGVISSGNVQGKVAFSACGKQQGFNGLIVTKNGTWLIQPQKLNSSTSSADENAENIMENGPTIIIPHIIVPINYNNTSTGHTNHPSLASDELHVPQDELEKAARLAKEEEEKYKRAENDNDHEDEDDINELIENEDAQKEGQEIILISTEGLKDMAKTERASSSSSSSRKRQRRRQTKRAATSSSSRRSSSAKPKASSTAPKQANVEIAVFADNDFYDEMKIRYPKDTMRKIKDYILTMVHSMDLLYQHDSLGTDLHFKLVHLEIQKKKPSKLNSHGGKAKSYLTSFCDYAGDLNINNNIWDHALMLTGHDLIEEGASSTAGLAWAGTMCYRYYSCSISEGTQFGSVFIITHEIGHSMGMEHDGMGVSSTCDEDKYLMSPTTGPGKVTWSTCSGQNLKDFLQYGTSELRGGKSASKPICMTESSRENKNIQYSSTTLPGEKYDANKQCLLSMGKKYTPVMRKDNPFNNICSMLYCGNGTHAISTHPALDGTECSTNKNCHGGKCVGK